MSERDTTSLTSASSDSVAGSPATTMYRTDPEKFATKPFASGLPMVSTLELMLGWAQDGNASGAPCARLDEVHGAYAGTSETRIGVAPFGRGKPVTSLRREDWIRRVKLSEPVHTAAAFASAFAPVAIVGSKASTPGAESVWTAPKLPFPGRTAAWIRSVVPSKRYQTATALPVESMEICGALASRPPGEIVWSPPKRPPAGRKAAWVRPWDPSNCVHTAIALPLGSNATCGSNASRPASEIV